MAEDHWRVMETRLDREQVCNSSYCVLWYKVWVQKGRWVGHGLAMLGPSVGPKKDLWS